MENEPFTCQSFFRAFISKQLRKTLWKHLNKHRVYDLISLPTAIEDEQAFQLELK